METKNRTRTKYRSGLFEDQTSAESSYQAALNKGYKPNEINVLMSEDTRKKYLDSHPGSTVAETETGDKSMEGLAMGGALGGTVVGVLAALVALSTTIVIPGIGLIIAGPLAAGLVGAGAGSIAGGLLGALIGAGIPEEHARIYAQGIKKGGVVILVNSHEDDEALLTEWKKNKGRDIF